MCIARKSALDQNDEKGVYLVSFRHPVTKDKTGRNGLKIHRSLKTVDFVEATKLCRQLDTLLNAPMWWSVEKKECAYDLFDPIVIDIFYAHLKHMDTSYLNITNAESLKRCDTSLELAIKIMSLPKFSNVVDLEEYLNSEVLSNGNGNLVTK